jgi:uncharacterized protein (DUF608 family)
VDFPIGGFGAGNVVLAGDGTLQKWTVVNQVRMTSEDMPACFFGVSAAGQSFALISPETYTDANCRLPAQFPASVSRASVERLQQTLPGVKSISLQGRFPIADVRYEIDGFPLEVAMEATSPMIPGDLKNSSLPVALFTFTLTNNCSFPIEARVLSAQQNFVGWDGQADCRTPGGGGGGGGGIAQMWGGNVNTPFCAEGSSGVAMANPTLDVIHPHRGTLAVSAVSTPSNTNTAAAAAAATTTTVIPGAASETDLWQAFCAGADVPPASADPTPPSAAGTSPCAGVVQTVTVPAHGSATVTFVTTWHFPNRQRDGSCGTAYGNILPAVLGNRYAEWFADARAVAAYVVSRLDYLLPTTRDYRDAMFATTMPPDVLDMAAGRAAVMRSATMWWTRDGVVMGCEGNGCCPLNCTHVYGYTTLMERLYPSAAKDMRISDFVRNYDKPGTASQWCGGCTMRFGAGGWAIDGALACILKTYLVVRQSDPTLTFLPTVWPNVKDQLRRIQDAFDPGDTGDGVIRGEQQNTYDTAMEGANTFIGSYYVAALRAMSAMATLMGEPELASACATRALLSRRNYETLCWNGQYGYYVADVTEANCKNSYGPGCFVDQLCGTGLASACGLGHVFDPDREASARRAVLRHNVVHAPPFKDLQKHLFDGDSGITVCTYPHGKLGAGMVYENLVSTGFTSPNIAGMMLDRNTSGAEQFCGLIRRRQDGRNASPWNEPECNLLYSRAMAHWNIFDQAAGFVYDAIEGSVAFDPRYTPTQFACFVTMHGGWGLFKQEGLAAVGPECCPSSASASASSSSSSSSCCNPTASSGRGLASGTATIQCLFGSIAALKSVGLNTTATSATAALDGKPVAVKGVANGVVSLTGSGVAIPKGSTLVITFAGGKAEPQAPCCVVMPGGGSGGTNNACCLPGCCPPEEMRRRCGAESQTTAAATMMMKKKKEEEEEDEKKVGGGGAVQAGRRTTTTTGGLVKQVVVAGLMFAAGVAVQRFVLGDGGPPMGM